MKKIVLSLISIVIAFTSYAQITQEHVIVTSKLEIAELIELENSGKKYYYSDSDNFVIKIYNLNHSIYKTIQLDIDQMGLIDFPEYETMLYPYCISENLFDSDNEIEFLLSVYAQSTDGQSHVKKTIIVNEDGSVLFEALNQSPVYDENSTQFPSWIMNTEEGTKMMLENYSNSEDDSLFIYNLPGQIPCFSCDGLTKKTKVNNTESKLSNYPNPAKEYTIIEYKIPNEENEAEIQIYDISGHLIKLYKVDKTFSNLRISTEELSNGTYIYNIKTKNNISKGKKLIINK